MKKSVWCPHRADLSSGFLHSSHVLFHYVTKKTRPASQAVHRALASFPEWAEVLR